MLVLAVRFFTWRLITLFILATTQHIDFTIVSGEEIFNVIFLFGWTNLAPVNHLWFIHMMIAIQLFLPFIKTIFDLQSTDNDSKKVMIVTLAVLFFLIFVLNDIDTFKLISVSTDEIDPWGITSWFNPLDKYAGACFFTLLLAAISINIKVDWLKFLCGHYWLQ